MTDTALPLASSASGPLDLLLPMACRHGLITGATGTGKTVTLQTLAQGFSRAGVPVFITDVKGDLSGISQPARPSDKLLAALKSRGMSLPQPEAAPATLWAVPRESASGAAQSGHPLRATVSDLGPLLLSRMLGLNDTQSAVLQLVFRIADSQGLLLLDLNDLRAMLTHVSQNASAFSAEFGHLSAASLGAIQRGLVQLEAQGAQGFFGEPMLDIHDLLQTAPSAQGQAHGVVNVLSADQLMQQPKLYATVLLWLLSELFEQLPEVGDVAKPKLVLFFDEAHLLFNDAPPALLERMELVVRLIRSKGVGVYFVTQHPLDVPESVLGQLGNRVQHALRAFTPRDQKAVKTAAATMRPNPGLDVETAITELAVGEALLSLLDAQGRPSPTQRVFIQPPASLLGPILPEQRQTLMQQSLVAGVYDTPIDRESAFERLQARVNAAASNPSSPSSPGASAGEAPAAGASSAWSDGLKELLLGGTGPRGAVRDGLVQSAAKAAVRSLASAAGREIMRGVLGGLLGGGSSGTRRRR